MICDIGELHVSYETRGEGMPVLMIHGFGIDRHVMIGCMEPIFRRRTGWKRIYFDLPGMGLTAAPPSLKNADQMLSAVKEFAKAIIPNNSFLVAAESYGAYLARGMVHSMPERLKGVLLICPVIIADRKQRDLPQHQVFEKDTQLLQTLKSNEFRHLFERVLVLQDKKRWNRFTQDIIPGRKAGDMTFLKSFERQGYSFSFDVDRLRRSFDRPSLILAGRQDVSVGYRDTLNILENYSRGTFAILDRSGHGLEVEQEIVFNCLVNEWLDRVKEEWSSQSV
jgi:pimeloyl-ACP methyl ester carboxylesterase